MSVNRNNRDTVQFYGGNYKRQEIEKASSSGGMPYGRYVSARSFEGFLVSIESGIASIRIFTHLRKRGMRRFILVLFVNPTSYYSYL